MATRHWLAGISAALFFGHAMAWLGPSESDPYVLGEVQLQTFNPTWRWEDARTTIQLDNLATRDGYRLGDKVFKPRPFDYLQAEFTRQVVAHPARDALQSLLANQTLRLLDSDVSVGLWMRLTEHQQGNWDMVRVRLTIEFNGGRYEALDTHPFRSREKPSPVSSPMQAVVKSLVNQLHLFASGAPESATAAENPEPAPPTDADVLRLSNPAN